MVDVAIVGAGPYGLSIAAHLKASGVGFRIFGTPMQTWLAHMPRGMRLKSDGFASSLYDPDSTFTLAHYCQQRGLPYADLGLPVALETFASYGVEFQRKFVPELVDAQVLSVERSSSGFQIRLGDGRVVDAKRVVAAVGLSYFSYVAPVLAGLSEEFVTHSSRHCTLDRFRGSEVTVVGAGASAVDVAALLHQVGASVQLVARKPSIRFHDRGQVPRPLIDRLRAPTTGLGPGWKSLFFTSAPLVFRHLPEPLRLEYVRTHLGPAPGWSVKDNFVGKVPCHLGSTITSARVHGHRVNLELEDSAGKRRTLVTDHVIAATGYKVDLHRISILSSDLVGAIRSVDRTPVLSSYFESSVPGLYFVGAAAANSFGPLLRFAYGARFTAQRLSHHLAISASNGR